MVHPRSVCFTRTHVRPLEMPFEVGTDGRPPGARDIRPPQDVWVDIPKLLRAPQRPPRAYPSRDRRRISRVSCSASVGAGLDRCMDAPHPRPTQRFTRGRNASQPSGDRLFNRALQPEVIMPVPVPPEPAPIVRSVERISDAADAERESKAQRRKRQAEIERGVNASNQPKTSQR